MLLIIKKPAKKQHLVINRVAPVFPRMPAWPYGKIMRDISRKQFIVQVFIYLVKKVAAAAIKSNSQRIRL